MKANQVSEHFDFMTERIFIKIACGGTLGSIPWGLIGTCSNVSHVMLKEQKLFVPLPHLNPFFEYFSF